MSSRCNNPSRVQGVKPFIDALHERDLLSYNEWSDTLTALRPRNQDRVRVLRRLTQHPEGVPLNLLCHHVLKGHRPDNYVGTPDLSGDTYDKKDNWADKYWNGSVEVKLDGSDDDYQFLRRYVDKLADTDLVTVEKREQGETNHKTWIFPTLPLFDLISAGITETTTVSDDLVYDRDYAENMLKSTRSRLLRLSDSQKSFLANALRRYIQRTRDYKLAFDVHMADRTGHDTKRMYKPYATRFTESGRRDRMFARLQDSLEWGQRHADCAVFATLTTDPKKHDSLWDAIMAINRNFHALNQYLATDPSTLADTRKPGVVQWSGPDCSVTGRPRERLEYVKVLEFTEAGYPHLHVLYFDPPRRDRDGMPWLIDKNELSHWWDKDTETRTGQGRVVDTYPLVYRDDLDDLDTEFNAEEGFVSWYRYGDHSHGQEWVEEKAEHHKEDGQIDFDGNDENPMEKTVGSYLGKYLSETYKLLQNLESLDDPEFQADLDGKSSWWKLALYWVTNRRFWSPSRRIEQDIDLDDDRSDIRRGVAEATRASLLHHTERCYEYHACYPELDRSRADGLLALLCRDLIADMDLEAQNAGMTQTTLANVEYLGTYHKGNLPARPRNTVNHRTVMEADADDEADFVILRDNKPPPGAA